MKILTSLLLVSGILYLIVFTQPEIKPYKKPKKFAPSDWFFNQRAYPFDEIPYKEYFDAMKKKKEFSAAADNTGLDWNFVGPSNIGGRVCAVVADPNNPNIIIIGAAAGGIFKTTNGGNNWTPKTDFAPSLGMGSLEMDPANPNIIYAGTGESNAATDSYPGYGILKSTDKGDTWNVIGLSEVLNISEVKVHPLNSNIIYAAGLGYRSMSPNKGIYKSTNAGVNWNRVLFVTDSTSAIDVDVDPSDINIVYAAMWERIRTPPTISKTGGITSGLYRSSNGGANWTLLGAANGLPAPLATTGRINAAVSKTNPSIVYAIYRTTTGNNISAVYKSTNKGLNWTSISISGVQSSGFDWYFGLIETPPNAPNTVYIGSIDVFRTTNSGSGTWQNITNAYSGGFEMQHPDQHALWINPNNTQSMILGNDGGVFTTSNGGTNWSKKYDLPITQYYAGCIDYLNPNKRYGGTQDNGSSGSINPVVTNWEVLWGGDGFHCAVDYTNSNVIFMESQNGGLVRSLDGGNFFDDITNGIDMSRTNWSSPYSMDIQTPSTLYFGSYKLFRTTNRGDTWTAISPDLTKGQNGRLGTLTCISNAVLPNNSRVIYTGADDGRVMVTTNSGTNWTEITTGLPNRYVTDVVADKRNPAIAYVTLSGFNIDQRNTHIYRTTNFGATWTNISANLLNVPVNSLIIDYSRDSYLYVGTDAGVFYTSSLGRSWGQLGTGLPNAPVFDLIYHQPSSKLVAATHGRSMFEISILNVPTHIEGNNEIVKSFELYQNYPNPFNPMTTVEFKIPAPGFYELKIFDISGKLIETLVSGELSQGTHQTSWNASRMASGIYFYGLYKNGNNLGTKKMMLVK